MPIKRQTYRLDQIDDWQGPVQQSGPTRDAAAQRVRDRLAAMSPTERVLSELTERPPTPRAAFPLRENAQTPRPMPPMAGQMFLDAGLGALEAFDQPPTGMPAGVPYTTPLRLLSASGAVPSALAARAYDASSRGSVMADAPVVDPLQPADKQSMFSTAIAQRGGGKGAQALGFIADLLTPDVTDAFTGGLLPLAAMAGGLKKVNTGRTLINGLYSRLDEAAAMIPTKGVPATGVLNWLKKAPEGISLEEVAYRKLPEWLESQGTKTVTPEMLAAHLKENPAPFPQVKTLGGGVTHQFAPPEQQAALLARLWHLRDEMSRLPYGSPEYQAAASEARAMPAQLRESVPGWGIAPSGERTKFSQYQVDGGENYRETMLMSPETDAMRAGQHYTVPPPHQYGDPGLDVDRLLHTRSNERTLPTGEPGRFIEEVQSDWHQQGLKKGYRIPGDRDRANNLLRQMDEIEREVGLAQAADDPRYRALGAELDTASTQNPSSVPDAPFKENWPDLGLKQQLIEAANDPNAEWMGFTGGKTQADRYDLSKQISRIEYEPISDPAGTYELQAYDHNDRLVLSEDEISLDRVEQLVGKEIAEKVKSGGGVVQDEGGYRDWRTLSGLDLQVGGEGMDVFYDRKLPKRLEKIVKPFGGTVEQGAVSPNPARKWPDTAQGRAMAMTEDPSIPMWLSRLTPEMKAAMRERGFPLMSLAGPVAAQGIPDDPNSETDDYARLALNMGSMAALGMAAKGMAGSAPSGGSLAELASKRMSAAEAEAAGLWHPIGDGKRLAMSVPEMRFQRDIDPVVASRMPDRRVMRLSDLEGSALVPAIGDRSMAGYTLTGVGGVELPNPVKLEGGRDFMRTHSSQGSVWASKKGVVTRITNQIKKAAEASKKSGGTGEVFMVYVPGSHGTTDYSTMMSDALLEQIKGGTFTKKAVREFDAYVRNLRPEWVGLMHPKARTQLDTTTGELRHAFADAVELKSMQDMGFPNIAQTRAAITEPSLMDTPLFSGGSSVAKVDGRIIRDPAIQHSTYDTQMGGTYAGALEKDIPYREMFSDFTAERRASGAPVSGDDRSFQLKFPYQIVTSEWVKKNSGKLQSMGMVAVPVAAGAAAMQSDKPKNGRKTYRLDQIDR